MTESHSPAASIKLITKGSGIWVHERTLEPGQVIPWHYHTINTVTTHCIEGALQIKLLDPPERVLLAVGQGYAIPTNRPYQVTPHGDLLCRFLHMQCVANNDRHPVDPKTWRG